MTVPKPTLELKGHCTVISGNTLYAFSSKGFISIPLEVNGNWTTLNPGVPVSNPVCLKGGIEGSENADEALYVLGGTTTTADSTYSGIQRFSFKDQRWQNLTSGTTSMSERTGHGAAFVASNSSIIVYGGNSDASTNTSPSSYTVLISTKAPYFIKSELSQEATSLNNPQLLPLNSTHVGMFGGDDNYAVYTYSVGPGWVRSPVSLPTAISTSTPLTLLSGPGENKVLEFFNMDASPNTVTNYEIISSDGKPQSTAVVVGSSQKRSTGSYPTYNDTFAPSNKWSDYALAQGSNGMVVLSSGQSNDSLAIFNQTSNSWINSTELFQGKSIQQVLIANTTSSIPTATPTPAASTSASATPSSTTTAAAAASGGSHTDIKLIIGAVLGSVCGVIIILLVLLWLLKRERTRRGRSGQVHGGDSKDRLSFQDQGIEPLAGGAYPMAKSAVPVASMSADSLAIISGKYGGEKSLVAPPSNAGYGLSAPRKSSPLSPIPSSGLVPSSMWSEEAYRNSTTPSELGKPRDRTTDEDWGKYFQDNNATNLSGMPADRSTTSSIYTKSDYRGSAWPMSNLTPLSLGFLDQPKPLGRVYSGSPTTEHASSSHSLAIPQGQSARISSADSISVTSDDDPHDTNWTGAHTSWLGRPASSNYSFYNSSTRDLPSSNPQLARQSNGRRSSVAIPEDIDELPMPGRSNNVNSDMSWLNLQADK